MAEKVSALESFRGSDRGTHTLTHETSMRIRYLLKLPKMFVQRAKFSELRRGVCVYSARQSQFGSENKKHFVHILLDKDYAFRRCFMINVFDVSFHFLFLFSVEWKLMSFTNENHTIFDCMISGLCTLSFSSPSHTTVTVRFCFSRTFSVSFMSNTFHHH